MANQYDTNLKLQAIADAIEGQGGVTPSLANLAKDTTLQATNTALGLLTKDTTLQSTNTALVSLASDSSLQAIADDLETGSDLITALGDIATAITQGGGGGGTTNYNDLSNKPSINSTTLSGNKTGAELGLAGTADISNINITGSNNTTGSTIGKGVTFYLNGSLCIALTNIASGATFTSGTNYSTITIGEELSTLNSNTAKYTLLWTNLSPTSAYAAQDIPLDISGYDDIYIETTEGVCIGKVGNGTYNVACGLSSGVAYLYYRSFNLSNTAKVTVGAGQQTKVSDGSTTTVNALYVPIRIYGVKIG